MLFEAGSVKAGGGENWIPLCLPGFNNTGYLYMYVSFLNLERPTEQMQERPSTSEGAPDEVAILLISAQKESFFELRSMRDDLVEVRAFPFSFRYQKNHSIHTLWDSSPSRRYTGRGTLPGDLLGSKGGNSRNSRCPILSPGLDDRLSSYIA
jgi:hypothetical protein